MIDKPPTIPQTTQPTNTLMHPLHYRNPQRRTIPKDITLLLLNLKIVIRQLKVKPPQKVGEDKLHLNIREALAETVLGADAEGLEGFLTVVERVGGSVGMRGRKPALWDEVVVGGEVVGEGEGWELPDADDCLLFHSEPQVRNLGAWIGMS